MTTEPSTEAAASLAVWFRNTARLSLEGKYGRALLLRLAEVEVEAARKERERGLDVDALARAFHEKDERLAVTVDDDSLRCDHSDVRWECQNSARYFAELYLAAITDTGEGSAS